MDDERGLVALLCTRLADLRAEIAHHPAAVKRLFTEIEAEARAGRPIGHLLGRLPINLDGTTRDATPGHMFTPHGVPDGPASEERFGCPGGLCDRIETTLPAGPLPRCQLTGRYLHRRSN